jgi:hypothetical protein
MADRDHPGIMTAFPSESAITFGGIPTTTLQRALQGLNRGVETVSLCDEQSNDRSVCILESNIRTLVCLMRKRADLVRES